LRLWDHLDHPTLTALQPRVRSAVTPLGVGGYLEQWGYARDQIREGDWYTSLPAAGGITIHVLPARHYSGRMLTRSKTLWASFALESADRQLYFGGDSGWGARNLALPIHQAACG
jgi:L-ascorbate metabolism protein UlaG (beta-lactamase superfamily)